MEFVISEKLPSLNEYVNACRKHWAVGSKMKKDTDELIRTYIIEAIYKKQVYATAQSCNIYFEWHEKDKRRDVDNIQSGQKFILDALQETGIIVNDSRKYVKQIFHEIIDDEKTFVVCNIEII